MSIETATINAPATAAKAKPVKKPVKAKAAVTKTKAEGNGKPEVKKTGLRKPQVRILQYLNKTGAPATRAVISAKAPVDLAFCTEYLGSSNEEVRLKNDAKILSLLSMKAVKLGLPEEEGGAATYAITATGKKLLETATK